MARRRGVTLIEMLIVVVIIGTIVSLSAPALTSGLAGVRLESSANGAAAFLTATLNTVERRELALAIVIEPRQNRIDVYTAASGEKPSGSWTPQAGVEIEGNSPGANDGDPRRYALYPGGTFPRIALLLRNEKGGRRSVEIDPITGVPSVGRPGDSQQ